jgi:methionyl aminopeptidase
MIVYLNTKEEIEDFKVAGEEAAKILQLLKENVCVGITTLELDSIVRRECDKNNLIPTFLGYRGFPATICTSVNEILVHGIPNNIPLKENDLLSIDIGITVNGFIGDVAETVCVSKIENNIIDTCRKSLYTGIKQARAGNHLNDISKEIFNVANENKFSVPVNYGGHGINRNVLHAAPFVANIPDIMEDCVLRPGMILAIEPMFIDSASNQVRVAEDKWSVIAQGITAHFEHTVLITENDPIILTKL